MRPIYHRKPRRADGHLFITVIAYQLVQLIRTRLRAHGSHACWTTLRRLDPRVLAPGVLPELWGGESITVVAATDYFAGGRTVMAPRDTVESVSELLQDINPELRLKR